MCAGSHLRVLELFLDTEPATLPERGGRYPVLAPGDDAWSLIGRIPGIPAAILIDSGGTVLRSFYGTEHDGLKEAIEQYLFP